MIIAIIPKEFSPKRRIFEKFAVSRKIGCAIVGTGLRTVRVGVTSNLRLRTVRRPVPTICPLFSKNLHFGEKYVLGDCIVIVTLRKDDEIFTKETEMTKEITLQLFAEGEADAQGSAENTDGENAAAKTAEEQTQSAENEADENSEKDEFEALIKGKFSKEFARRTQSIIDRRFAKAKLDEQRLGELKPLLDAIRKAYPDVEADNIPELIKAVQTSDAPEKQKAVPDLNRLKEMKARLEEKRSSFEKQKIISDWEKQAQKLKEIYPDFDLSKAVYQTDFAQLLKAGVSVRKAYEAANIESILGSAMHYAAATVGRKTAQSIRMSSARVQENSVLDRAASKKSTNVNLLTEKDIMKILDEVKKGAKIRF